MKVFILWEREYSGRKSLVDIFSDWKQCEDCRVGMNSQRIDGFISYEITEEYVK